MNSLRLLIQEKITQGAENVVLHQKLSCVKYRRKPAVFHTAAAGICITGLRFVAKSSSPAY